MTLRNRLRRLEKASPPAPRPRVVFLAEDGNVLDDGSAVTRPWIGEYYRELPGPCLWLRGVDPFEVLGRPRERSISEDT